MIKPAARERRKILKGKPDGNVLKRLNKGNDQHNKVKAVNNVSGSGTRKVVLIPTKKDFGFDKAIDEEVKIFSPA